MAAFCQADSCPVARLRHSVHAIVEHIALDVTLEGKAVAVPIIVYRSQNDGEIRMADDVHHTADPVFNVQGGSHGGDSAGGHITVQTCDRRVGDNAFDMAVGMDDAFNGLVVGQCKGPLVFIERVEILDVGLVQRAAVDVRREGIRRATEFDDQTGIWTTLHPQATEGVEIGNNQVFKQDMVDPDVIEHDLVGKDTAPDVHAVIRVVDDDVASHQRTAVLRCVGAEQADMAGRAAQVIANVMGKRIDPDGQGLSGVIADNIVQQYRLATSYQNRSRDIGLAANAIRIDVVDVFDAVVVVFNQRVRQTQVRLVDLEHVEVHEATLDPGVTTGKREVRVIDTGGGILSEENAGPIPGCACGQSVLLGIESTAAPEPVIEG